MMANPHSHLVTGPQIKRLAAEKARCLKQRRILEDALKEIAGRSDRHVRVIALEALKKAKEEV